LLDKPKGEMFHNTYFRFCMRNRKETAWMVAEDGPLTAPGKPCSEERREKQCGNDPQESCKIP
jgi:hypothetical protein